MSAPVALPPPVQTATLSSSRISPPIGAVAMLRNLLRHRELIGQLTWREVLGRYRGSYLGLLWSFINPVVLLIIFTIVFKIIFRAKFSGHGNEGDADFALVLFAGLIIFNHFAECLSRAPTLIMSNSNFVSKVVFPLEVLPVTIVLAAVIHLVISFVPLCLGVAFIRQGGLPATIVQWPLLIAPIVFWSLGVTWLLAAVGVFLRDLNQVMLSAVQILMYTSAIFYPIERLTQNDRMSPAIRRIVAPLVLFNPLARMSEQARNVVEYGVSMDWKVYGWVAGGGLIFMWIGYAVFVRVKHAFADVI
jgi:lipopolysaccharide transport system permease protein